MYVMLKKTKIRWRQTLYLGVELESKSLMLDNLIYRPDNANAFDSIRFKELWFVLEEMGTP